MNIRTNFVKITAFCHIWNARYTDPPIDTSRIDFVGSFETTDRAVSAFFRNLARFIYVFANMSNFNNYNATTVLKQPISIHSEQINVIR